MVPRSTDSFVAHLVVKFRDDVAIADGASPIGALESLRLLATWSALKRRFAGVQIRRLFTYVPVAVLRRRIALARERDPQYRPGNLPYYFTVLVTNQDHSAPLLHEIKRWAQVEFAYIDPPPAEPAPPNLVANPNAAFQTYHLPGPLGINSEAAWQQQADGSGQYFIDIERGWNRAHPDLKIHGIPAPLHTGPTAPSQSANTKDHGTAVLGIICAADNTRDCVGIAYKIGTVGVASYDNGSNVRADTIMAAADALPPGGVLLLEMQLPDSMLPVETLQPEYEAIRYATARGVVVIEAAGNGSANLDEWRDPPSGYDISANLNRARTDGNYRESNAIMVGAGVVQKAGITQAYVPGETVDEFTELTRWKYGAYGSNFGSRIDCFAAGNGVTTLKATQGYTQDQFAATSAAAAIIAGVAILSQQLAESWLGRKLEPLEMRKILSTKANGTSPVSIERRADAIGTMPDLGKIIASGALGRSP